MYTCTIIERALKVQKEKYLRFIDYTNCDPGIRHEIIIHLSLTQLKIGGADLRLIKNIYWEQTAAMRVNGESAHLK